MFNPNKRPPNYTSLLSISKGIIRRASPANPSTLAFPTATGISEGSVGDLAVVAMNSDAKPDYAGPCPPEGETHRYSLSVYAVSQVLEAQTGDGAPSLRAAIEAAALEVATTEFTYSR